MSKVPSMSYTRIIGALQAGRGGRGEGKVAYSRPLKHKSNKMVEMIHSCEQRKYRILWI